MDEDIKSHKIMQMDEQKRERVLNAAMAEFRNGYAKASTDNIVREAGISKGLLFHYFGTKEKLHEFLVKYTVDVILSEFYSLVNFEQPDLLERIWQMLLLKMELSYKYPAIFDFVGAAYAQEGAQFSAFTTRYTKESPDMTALLTKGVDVSQIKDGFDVDKVINIIRWAVIAYSNSQIDISKSIEDYRKEFDKYLEDIKGYFDIFRKAFYKSTLTTVNDN